MAVANLPSSAEPERDIAAHPPDLAVRRFKDRSFVVWGIVATLIGLATLAALVIDLFVDGAGCAQISSSAFLPPSPQMQAFSRRGWAAFSLFSRRWRSQCRSA
jgi:hypothetical protein